MVISMRKLERAVEYSFLFIFWIWDSYLLYLSKVNLRYRVCVAVLWRTSDLEGEVTISKQYFWLDMTPYDASMCGLHHLIHYPKRCIFNVGFKFDVPSWNIIKRCIGTIFGMYSSCFA